MKAEKHVKSRISRTYSLALIDAGTIRGSLVAWIERVSNGYWPDKSTGSLSWLEHPAIQRDYSPGHRVKTWRGRNELHHLQNDHPFPDLFRT